MQTDIEPTEQEIQDGLQEIFGPVLYGQEKEMVEERRPAKFPVRLIVKCVFFSIIVGLIIMLCLSLFSLWGILSLPLVGFAALWVIISEEKRLM